MAIDVDIFAEDFAIALADIPTNAAFDNFHLNVLFQKVNQQETPLMEGVEGNLVAVAYVSLASLGTHTISIGDKCTINSNQYRVNAVNPYTHGQFYRLDLVDENS